MPIFEENFVKDSQGLKSVITLKEELISQHGRQVVWKSLSSWKERQV